ncbi:TlpA disulfide reductase family protein [Desulfopila inferna]|uniref:TlpA disulfide reductase family protein n=1 Tax=Desulfopila inferna TaxID=468528 RepID=UPI001963FBDE|nr:TlpA disulfide reductase family protein [Desulfopila inferna]MBM9606672.1 TlpA family protein disulfide reductase [Desulfopila inferna]
MLNSPKHSFCLSSSGRIRKSAFLQVVFIGLALLYSTTASGATKMPDFALPNILNENTISSSSFEGKALLLTFFATWCPPCMEEVPTLIKLQEKYGRADFSVIGFSVDQGGAAVVRKFVDKKSINYPVALADARTMQDFGGVYGIPVSFLVNKEGNVVKKYTGYIPQSVLEKDLKKIL